MTEHNPMLCCNDHITTSINPTTKNVEIRTTCSCGDNGCYYTYTLDTYDWMRIIPVVIPEDTYLSPCGNIEAIQEVRNALALPLFSAKELVIRSKTASMRTSEQTKNVNGVRTHCIVTYLPHNDDAHKYVIAIKYSRI